MLGLLRGCGEGVRLHSRRCQALVGGVYSFVFKGLDPGGMGDLMALSPTGGGDLQLVGLSLSTLAPAAREARGGSYCKSGPKGC